MNHEAKTAITEANNRFYRALELGSLERMEAVWAHEDWVKCVHPGWETIIGWRRVRESWARIFESGQRMRASASEVLVHSSGDFGWVMCTENITVFSESSFDSAQAAATNLFIFQGGCWLMAHHHASVVPSILPDVASKTIQ